MIDLLLLFIILVVFFAMVGYLRGWQREVITMFGLIGGVAMLQRFGFEILNLLGVLAEAGTADDVLQETRRSQVLVQAFIFVLIAFFSYQIVGALAVRVSGGKLAERIRATLERRIIGLLFGTVNGYLIVGTFWSFLEYEPVADGYSQLAPERLYPFDPLVIVRPTLDTAARAFTELLPLGALNPDVWLIVFFLMFFFVIIALI